MVCVEESITLQMFHYRDCLPYENTVKTRLLEGQINGERVLLGKEGVRTMFRRVLGAIPELKITNDYIVLNFKDSGRV